MEEKIRLLGDKFRGLWQTTQIDGKNYVVANRNDMKTYWYVTFKYNGDFLETESQDTIEEALDYAIEFLGIK